MGDKVTREQIERLRGQVGILDLANLYGLKIARRHTNCVMVRCPWHDDKTPSLALYVERGRFYCFSSSCNKSGDIFNFVQNMEQLGFYDAVRRVDAYVNRNVFQTAKGLKDAK